VACKFYSTTPLLSPVSELSASSHGHVEIASFSQSHLDLVLLILRNPSGSVLNYNGSNVHLQGFEQGINLIVGTPFIVAAVVGVFLNLVLPKDKTSMSEVARDAVGNPVLDGRK
jgi:hypothetical protein